MSTKETSKEKLSELDMANISLVEIINGTPHCKMHGAMNMGIE